MCPHCGMKMRAPDKSRGRIIRCLACDGPFGVPQRLWYFRKQGEENGPVCPTFLQALARDSLIRPDTLVRKGEEGRWVPASRVCGLFRNRRTEPPALPNAEQSIDIAVPSIELA